MCQGSSLRFAADGTRNAQRWLVGQAVGRKRPAADEGAANCIAASRGEAGWMPADGKDCRGERSLPGSSSPAVAGHTGERTHRLSSPGRRAAGGEEPLPMRFFCLLARHFTIWPPHFSILRPHFGRTGQPVHTGKANSYARMQTYAVEYAQPAAGTTARPAPASLLPNGYHIRRTRPPHSIFSDLAPSSATHSNTLRATFHK